MLISHKHNNDTPTTYVKWLAGKQQPETFTAIDF